MSEPAAVPSPVADRLRPAYVAASDAPEAAPLWHLAWVLGVATVGAGLLAGLGAMSWRILAALALGLAPGLLGYFWKPAGRDRLTLLAAWAVMAVVAAGLDGGATGPLGLWCLTPLLAGALIGVPAEGAVLAAAALAAAVLIELAGVSLAAPSGALGVGLAAGGLATVGGATAAALGILMRRARERIEAAEAEQAWLGGVVADSPHMLASLDRDGSAEALFGAAIPGLGAEDLRGGLLQAVRPEDREGVRAAICEALDHGVGEAVFTPAAAPDHGVALTLRRRAQGGLAAVLRQTTAPQARPVAPALLADPDLVAENARLRGLLAESEGAERRLAALEQKLKITGRARTGAFAALSREIAARQSAEAARAQAEAEATGRSRFLANMSHELRTPLNAIMGFSEIMRVKMFGDLSPRYAEYAELIHESGRHLTDLINDVLDMSKIEAERYTLSREVFDVREAVNSALRLVRLQADDAGVQLRGVLPPQALLVDADKRAIKQIVLNLVSNALKFTPAGGSVTVTAQAAAGAFELVVADTGVGIAKDDLDRLGKPFEQAGDADHRAQGTGLGLSLVKAFARLHGGEMGIESELGDGAAVTVRLPVLVRRDPPPPVVAPSPLISGIATLPDRPDGLSNDDNRPRGAEIVPIRPADVTSLGFLH